MKWIMILAITVATCSQMADLCAKKCFSKDCDAQCVMADMICKAMVSK